MSMINLRDINEPARAEGGDLVSASGADLAMQQVIRLLFMRPGELLHRPDLGAGLSEYQNRPMLPQDEQEMANAIRRLMDGLQNIAEYSFEISSVQGKPNASMLNMQIRTVDGSTAKREIIV